jgi:hypothetical protein
MRKLLALLKPGGTLALTLRHGSADTDRAMHPVTLVEVERLAREHGALVVRVVEMPDQMGRPDVSWTGVGLQLLDDGTGALPLLRHVILNDQKTATYKLGLLRVLCRAADGQAGMAEERDEDTVVLPLGLVALNWLRLYLPLVDAGLPQAPRNAGPDGLGFAGEGFRALMKAARCACRRSTPRANRQCDSQLMPNSLPQQALQRKRGSRIVTQLDGVATL